MPKIRKLIGREILDSRGRPTVEARCELVGGARVSASVPSGASTGAAEAWELRDGDATRFRGLGCRRAAGNISGEIYGALREKEFETQGALDAALIALDGTENKARLGANALLAVSLAFARAWAVERGVPLYRHFATSGTSGEEAMLHLLPPRSVSSDDPMPRHVAGGESLEKMPRLTINLFSGGKHAGGQVAIQDVLLVPSAKTVAQGLADVFAVYQAAAELGAEKYGMRALTADEGGLAPPFPNAEGMLSDAVEAIGRAGFTPGREMALAVDVAASHFYAEGMYFLDGERLNGGEMVGRVERWLDAFPIVSVEDALAQEDWEHWAQLRERVGERALVLGDDFLCTNPARIRRAIGAGAVNALLLKVNQIGTLSEAEEALRLARGNGWHVTISARSGETEDDWLADLAVGWQGDDIKVGSITHSERLAKYNRLLAIEMEVGFQPTFKEEERQ